MLTEPMKIAYNGLKIETAPDGKVLDGFEKFFF